MIGLSLIIATVAKDFIFEDLQNLKQFKKCQKKADLIEKKYKFITEKIYGREKRKHTR